MKRIIKTTTDYSFAFGPVEVGEVININIDIFDDSVEANTNSKFLRSRYTGEVKKFEYFKKFIEKAVLNLGFEIARQGEMSNRNKENSLSYYMYFYAKGPRNPIFRKIVIRCRFSNHKDPTNYHSYRYKDYSNHVAEDIRQTNPELKEMKTRRITIDNKRFPTYQDALNHVNKRLDEIAEEARNEFK